MNPAGYQLFCSIVPRPVCTAIRNEALALLEQRKRQPGYLKWRFWDSPINQPYHRHILKMPLTSNIRQAVEQIVKCHQEAGVDKKPVFGRDARWQTRVTRTPKGLQVGQLGGMDVTEAMGPTMMFPYSHSARNTEHNRRRTHMQRQYDASGEPEFLFDDGLAQSEAEHERTDARAIKALGTQPSAVAMLVQAGDVVLMDCKIFHFGSANRSDEPRALLNVTFQEPCAETQETKPIRGFTYHILPEVMAEKYTREDFLASQTKDPTLR